jgi:hypothetical protein
MTQISKDALKLSFETGNRPTQSDFENLIDSCVHRSEDKATTEEAANPTNHEAFITPFTARAIINPLLLTKEPLVTVSGSDEEFWSGNKNFKKVKDVPLTGLVASTASDLTLLITDKIIEAFGKIKAQFTSIQTQFTNLPTLFRLRTQYITLNSANNFGTSIAFQKMFNSTTNGAFTLVTGKRYKFRCNFSITNMHASNAGTFSFGMLGSGSGLATITIKYNAVSVKSVSPGPAELVSSIVTGETALVSSSAGTEGNAMISGIINCSAGGKLIPAFSLGSGTATSTSKVAIGSYFEIEEIGDTSVAFNGAWT